MTVGSFRWQIDKSTAEEGGNEYPIRKSIMHPDFRTRDNESDIAVLVLGTPKVYGEKKPVFLPLNKNPLLPAIGASVRVMGFGSLYFSWGPLPDVSRYLDLLSYR